MHSLFRPQFVTCVSLAIGKTEQNAKVIGMPSVMLAAHRLPAVVEEVEDANRVYMRSIRLLTHVG